MQCIVQQLLALNLGENPVDNEIPLLRSLFEGQDDRQGRCCCRYSKCHLTPIDSRDNLCTCVTTSRPSCCTQSWTLNVINGDDRRSTVDPPSAVIARCCQRLSLVGRTRRRWTCYGQIFYSPEGYPYFGDTPISLNAA